MADPSFVHDAAQAEIDRLRRENVELEARLHEAEDTLAAIRNGDVDGPPARLGGLVGKGRGRQGARKEGQGVGALDLFQGRITCRGCPRNAGRL